MDHEQALEEFEQAWRAARPLDLRQVVARFDRESTEPLRRRQLVHELVMIDFWHRWRSAAADVTGTAGAADTTIRLGRDSSTVARPWPPFPRLDDYVARYPDLLDATDFPVELIAEEYRARRRFGDQPTHQEFFRRFPQQSGALAPLLVKIDSQLTRDLGGHTLPPGDQPRTGGDALLGGVLLPEKIGKYVVLAPLDRGGQGRIFRAIHPDLRQELAIKLGHPLLSADLAQQDALVAEARLLAQLDHPNLVRVHDLGFHENCPYVVLDYVPGRNLREIAREQPLSPVRAAEIVAKIARALEAMHARGITHGDLKPANVLIDEHGEPRLIDFGIARERSALSPDSNPSDAISGTLLYMAPEQARGESARIGCRTDVYGLGAVLYELLVGQPPRPANSVEELIQSACRGDAQLAALDDPKIPQPLAATCRQALSPRLEDRQSSVLKLAEQIEQWLSRQQPAKPRRLVAALASLAVIASLAAGAALLANSPGTRQSAHDPLATAVTLVGHLPRHDFPLTFEVVGHPATEDVVRLRAGENIALRLHSEANCYVGVWHIDGAGVVTQLFPNLSEQDNFLPAKAPLTIPGQDSYTIQVSPSRSPEYLWIAATTQPWALAAGNKLGPAVVLAAPDQATGADLRPATLVERRGARVSECVVQLEVSAPVELATHIRR